MSHKQSFGPSASSAQEDAEFPGRKAMVSTPDLDAVKPPPKANRGRMDRQQEPKASDPIVPSTPVVHRMDQSDESEDSYKSESPRFGASSVDGSITTDGANTQDWSHLGSVSSRMRMGLSDGQANDPGSGVSDGFTSYDILSSQDDVNSMQSRESGGSSSAHRKPHSHSSNSLSDVPVEEEVDGGQVKFGVDVESLPVEVKNPLTGSVTHLGQPSDSIKSTDGGFYFC